VATLKSHLTTEIMGPNPGRGTDICPRLSVFYCSVKVEALLWGEPPSYRKV